jgi:Leucine-rich repeat (LRR) protein
MKRFRWHLFSILVGGALGASIVLGVQYFSHPTLRNASLDEVKAWITKMGGSTTTIDEKIICLDFRSGKLCDDDLRQLAESEKLRDLEFLNLTNCRITNEGLGHVAQFQKLKGLNLKDTSTSAAGLNKLAGMKLAVLEVHYSEVRASDVAFTSYLAAIECPIELDLFTYSISDQTLTGLPKSHFRRLTMPWNKKARTDLGLKCYLAALKTPPESLNLTSWNVTDEGLKELINIKDDLRELNLSGCKITDAGVKELAKLSKLRSLDLYATKITDAAMKNLAELSKLESLNLVYTRVTDKGLEELAQMNRLESVKLHKSGVTQAGVAELRKQLPECGVVFNPKYNETAGLLITVPSGGGALNNIPGEKGERFSLPSSIGRDH